MVGDPKNHVAIALIAGWGKDYMNASTFFIPLFAGASVGGTAGTNLSLVGATPEQLQEWG